MKIAFSGTQIGLSIKQHEELINLIKKIKPIEAHHGLCIGSDAEFHDIIRKYFPNYKIIGHPPLNKNAYVYKECDEYRKAKEYLIRNHDIVDESDILIACPFENKEILRSGTWATIRYARKLNKEIIIIDRNEKENAGKKD